MQAEEPMQKQKSGTLTADMPPSSETGQPAWRAIIAPWWKAALAVLPTFLITRLIFLLLTYFGGVLFTVPNYSTTALTARDVLYSWYRWDAIRFITIATKGYISLDYAAFFPLYPALERTFSSVLHLDILLTGMLISNIVFFGTLIVLYRLVESEFDSATAKRTALYLSIFPTAFFFFAAYNESLFLFFLLLSFYTMRRGLWWLAGLFGGLATLTRSIGLLLVVIFLCEYVRQEWPRLRQSWKEDEGLHILRHFFSLLAVVLIPLGLGVYSFGLYKIFGDPLAFSHAQVNWRENLNFPWVAPFTGLKILATQSPFTFASPHIIIDLTALLLFLLLLVLTFFGPERFARHQWTFALFGLLALVYALLFPGSPGAGGIPYDPIPSTQRFVLEIFAGFIMMARLGRRPWFHQGYLLLALPLLAFLVFQFITGHWTV
ncbi:MAG TPA: mannosyltransferase family protein [Ktedonosporobacter sp.]|nr:mannosyltransferase family protein [Ktedonosporobacter sp.]